MLILTRRVGERIIIDDHNGTVVEISIMDIKFKKKWVGIGIDAPDYVAIHRKEVYDRLEEEKNALSGTK